MRGFFAVLALGFLGLHLSGCRENVQSASILFKRGDSFIEYRFQFDKSQKAGSASVWTTNDRGQLCHRALPFIESDAVGLTELLKQLETCSYDKISACTPSREESATVTFRDGPTVKADLSAYECSPNKNYLCGQKAADVASLAVVMAMVYGDRRHPDFKCD